MSHLETRQWYVVYSKPHKEKFAQFHLQLKGLEVFLPQLFLPQFLHKRKRIVPLFPNYLFVRIHIPGEYYHVLWSPGVKRFVGFNEAPTPVGEEIVAFLRQQANADGILTARSSLRVGQEVEITGGPFAGLIGIIQDPPNVKGRVRILMELLSRQVQVEVPVQLIKRGWAAIRWGAGT
jgi:transcription elongation factor/antiterminator RfaH